MDLFQEARWAFDPLERVGWYRNVVQGLLIKPRLPRVGVLMQDCPTECQYILTLRNAPQLLGLPAELANPLALFADVGNMEFNDECRICVETKYEANVLTLHAGIAPLFGGLAAAVNAYRESLLPVESPELVTLVTNLQTLAQTVTRDDVSDFLRYYVTRQLYAQLGADAYLQGYAAMGGLIQTCQASQEPLGLTCPALDITKEQAQLHLLAHADNVNFSSETTAGSALPFWDANGVMFAKTDDDTLMPVSGSGLDMSAPIDSLAQYVSVPLYDGNAVPGSDLWIENVEKNPIYSWFMGSMTFVEDGTGTLWNIKMFWAQSSTWNPSHRCLSLFSLRKWRVEGKRHRKRRL